MDNWLLGILGAFIAAVLAGLILYELIPPQPPAFTASPPLVSTQESKETESSSERSALAVAESAAPIASRSTPASNVSDDSCQPRIEKVQNQVWLDMQRFLDADNEDCLSLQPDQTVEFTIQNCGGKTAQPQYINFLGDYQDAYLATTNDPNDETVGVTLRKSERGWNIRKDSPISSARYSSIIIRGNGGRFCGIDLHIYKYL